MADRSSAVKAMRDMADSSHGCNSCSAIVLRRRKLRASVSSYAAASLMGFNVAKIIPKTGIIAGMRNSNLQWSTILGELIDNAFDAGAYLEAAGATIMHYGHSLQYRAAVTLDLIYSRRHNLRHLPATS